MRQNSKRIPHEGLTSPHSITVPDVTHVIVESASQATGYSTAALYSLGGELVAQILTYQGDEDQALDLIAFGSRLADLASDRSSVWWALENLKIGANQ